MKLTTFQKRLLGGLIPLALYAAVILFRFIPYVLKHSYDPQRFETAAAVQALLQETSGFPSVRSYTECSSDTFHLFLVEGNEDYCYLSFTRPNYLPNFCLQTSRPVTPQEMRTDIFQFAERLDNADYVVRLKEHRIELWLDGLLVQCADTSP